MILLFHWLLLVWRVDDLILGRLSRRGNGPHLRLVLIRIIMNCCRYWDCLVNGLAATFADDFTAQNSDDNVVYYGNEACNCQRQHGVWMVIN